MHSPREYLRGKRQQYRNWRAGRNWDRGRRSAAERASDSLRSRTPVFRNRTDPATGRPNRDRADLGRGIDDFLARSKAQREGRSR